MNYDDWKLQTNPDDELEYNEDGEVLCCPVCETPTKEGDYCSDKCFRVDNDD